MRSMLSLRGRGRRQLLDARLEALIVDNSANDNGNVRRYLKRLRRHREELFTFIDYEGVPADNNLAEREIRPAVMLRKRVASQPEREGCWASRSSTGRPFDPVRFARHQQY